MVNFFRIIFFTLSINASMDPFEYIQKIPEGYEVVFEDSFDELNVGYLYWSKEFDSLGYKSFYRPFHKPWRYNYPYGDLNNSYSFHDHSMLSIQKKNDDNYLDINVSKIKNSYYHGVLYSNFAYKYPVFRVIAKLPEGKGMWSAIWTIGSLGMPEIDIEHCSSWMNSVTSTIHWGYDYKRGYKKQKGNKIKAKSFNPTVNYYCYEIEVTPYSVIWKINGIMIQKYKNPVPDDLLHLIIGTGMGTYCDTTGFSKYSTMKVSEVQVLKKIIKN